MSYCVTLHLKEHQKYDRSNLKCLDLLNKSRTVKFYLLHTVPHWKALRFSIEQLKGSCQIRHWPSFHIDVLILFLTANETKHRVDLKLSNLCIIYLLFWFFLNLFFSRWNRYQWRWSLWNPAHVDFVAPGGRHITILSLRLFQGRCCLHVSFYTVNWSKKKILNNYTQYLL